MSIEVVHTRQDEAKPTWVGPIDSRLELVERKLESALVSEVPSAVDLSTHLLSAGGKRIRPALVILSALASSDKTDESRAVNLAAAAELVHMASLVHDDVVDETHERRGAATANAVWGNKMSVLGGDFLLAKAFSLLNDNGESDIIRVLADAAVMMTESEMLQAASEGSISMWEANYWRIIRGKTAAFMGACCKCGAILAGADTSVLNALAEYGNQLGHAFQITDDVLDIAGDPGRIGKDIGTDLVHGKFTLPVLLALKSDDSERRAAILDTVRSGSVSSTDARRVANLVIECRAADTARDVALDYSRKAQLQLESVPVSEYRAALDAMAAWVVDRSG